MISFYAVQYRATLRIDASFWSEKWCFFCKSQWNLSQAKVLWIGPSKDSTRYVGKGAKYMKYLVVDHLIKVIAAASAIFVSYY